MYKTLDTYLNQQTSSSVLSVFRCFFGFLMLFSIIRFWLKGWIDDLYLDPVFHFSYYGFEWVSPIGEYTYLIFFICGLSAFFVAIGFKYRVSIVIFFLSFLYIELMDKTTYLNHYYFINLDDDNSLTIDNINIPSPCVSVSFTYGFSQINNATNLYLNDSDNFHNLKLWPSTLGGGYHYMKLEGRYIDNYGEQKFYNTHTGGLNSNDYSINYLFDVDNSQRKTPL